MFTGLVEGVGRVTAVQPAGEFLRLTVALPGEPVAVGDSVAVAGACLTAVTAGAAPVFEVGPATRARTTLERLAAGDEVNVERALKAGAPLGGHFVTGHVDGVGTVRERRPAGAGAELVIAVPADTAALMVPRGSLAVDGVSLTIAGLAGETVTVALVPHTLENTTLKEARPGRPVNVEADILGKYVRRLLGAGGAPAGGGLDEETLRRHGFA